MAVALLVMQAVQAMSIDLRKNLSGITTISHDMDAIRKYETLTGELPNYPILTSEMLEKIGELPQVRNFEHYSQTHLLSDEIQRVNLQEDSMVIGALENWMPFELRGVRNIEIFDVEEGVIEISAGRTFVEQEVENFVTVAIVSENFAMQNELYVGSVFTLHDIVWIDGATTFSEQYFFASRAYSFEIVGLFTPLVEIGTGDAEIDAWISEEIENRIFVPNPVVITAQRFQLDEFARMYPDEEIAYAPEEFFWTFNAFALYSPQEIENFRKDVKKIASEFYTAIDLGYRHEPALLAIESFEAQAFLILQMTIVAGFITLSLFIILSTHDRKQEIGILLALGEKRGRIVFQMIAEVMVVALIAIIASLLIGNLVASSISENMLAESLIAAESETSPIFNSTETMGFVVGNMSADEILSDYNISLSAMTMFTFFAINIGVAAFATVLSALYFLRLSPRKILM